MSIWDKSKIRPEILKIMEKREMLRNQAFTEYFKDNEVLISKFQTLWKKVSELNLRWLRGENVGGKLAYEEMIFLAKQHRFAVEYRENLFQKGNPILKGLKVESVDAGSVLAEWQTVLGAAKNKVLLFFHGGGHILGSINYIKVLTAKLGIATKMRVLSINYRLAPEYPHPAALEDCIISYNWLRSNGIKPQNIIIAGESAGGYLALLTLLKIRDEGLPLPAGCICISTSTDMAQSGESRIINSSTDPILANVGYFWWIESHLAGIDPFDPSVSPLYADLTGLPPILLQVSASEMLFDDSKRFLDCAKKFGVDITMQVWNDTLHVFQQFDLPESEDAMRKIGQFVQQLI